MLHFFNSQLKVANYMKFPRLCFIFIRSYMEHICHVWVDALNCYVDVWDELQKRVAKLLGTTLTASLEHMPHLQNDAILVDIIFEMFMRTC